MYKLLNYDNYLVQPPQKLQPTQHNSDWMHQCVGQWLGYLVDLTAEWNAKRDIL